MLAGAQEVVLAVGSPRPLEVLTPGSVEATQGRVTRGDHVRASSMYSHVVKPT